MMLLDCIVHREVHLEIIQLYYFLTFHNRIKLRERGRIIFAKESLNDIGWTPGVTIKKLIKLFYYLLYGYRAIQGLRPEAYVKGGTARSCYTVYDSPHHKES